MKKKLTFLEKSNDIFIEEIIFFRFSKDNMAFVKAKKLKFASFEKGDVATELRSLEI